MKSKTSSTALNLIIITAIVVVVNYIVGGLSVLNFRADLTEKNIYTLSDGTKRILGKLNPDKETIIRFYATRDNSIMSQDLLNYADKVQDLLRDMQQNSQGRLKLEKIDPRPDTEEEERAEADDLQGRQVNMAGDKIYLGIAIQCLQQKEVLPFLLPYEEPNLEYQIARALAKVSTAKRPVIGVMSPMPIATPAMNFPGMPQRQRPPWVVMQQLRMDYDLREVPMSSDKIDADLNVLLIVHPFAISEKAQFAIDQFVLGGGNVIAFLDPQSLVAKAYDNPGQPGMSATMATSPKSDMPKLLAGWGITYDQNRMLADMDRLTPLGNGQTIPVLLTAGKAAINLAEPVLSSLDAIELWVTGAFGFDRKDGMEYVTLIESSENSELIDTSIWEQLQSQGLKTFSPDGKKKALAVKMTGRFRTAFPDGPPIVTSPAGKAPAQPGESGGEDKNDAGAPAAKDAKTESKPSYLKEGNGKATVFLFADADMIYDTFALQSDPNTGRVYPIAKNSNIPMLLNVVELLTGGSDLMNVRGRGVTRRPFTKMQELTSDVEAKYRPIVAQKEAELQEVVDQITAKSGVQSDGKGGGFISLKAGDVMELREKQIAIEKEIRSAKKEMTREKDRRELAITATNILGIPLLLVAFGIVLALRRSSLRAAH